MGPPPGSHLAAPGAYQENIAKLIEKYPNLEYADYKPLAQPRQFASPPRLVMFEFPSISASDSAPKTKHFNGIDEVETFLRTPTGEALAPDPVRRLWMLEGLHPSYVAVLGNAFDVDPRIWMRHQRIAIWERPFRGAGNVEGLPSLAAQQRGFTWSYCQLVHLNCDIQTFTIRCAENERHIALMRQGGKEDEGGKFDDVGVVHRKASFWFQKLQNSGWNALIVVDEPFKRILAGDRTGWKVVSAQEAPTPFQGGYQDFIPFTTMQDAMQSKGPPRSSIYDDLCYYIQDHHGELDLAAGPKASSFFLSKIVASESVLHAEYLKYVLNHLAWQLSRQNKLRSFQSGWIERRWSDLIAIQRRIGNYSDDVKITISTLGISNPAHTPPSWKDPLADFRWIEARLQMLQGDARGLVEAFSGLAGIVGNQQALSEARSISYLNILGTTFVPLSLIASILSLPKPYTPGASESWIYWAVAIPLVVAVYAAWFALTVGLKGTKPSWGTRIMSNIHGVLNASSRKGIQASVAQNRSISGTSKSFP